MPRSYFPFAQIRPTINFIKEWSSLIIIFGSLSFFVGFMCIGVYFNIYGEVDAYRYKEALYYSKDLAVKKLLREYMKDDIIQGWEMDKVRQLFRVDSDFDKDKKNVLKAIRSEYAD